MEEDMPRFRKKPVVIEARQLTGGTIDYYEIAEWCDGNVNVQTSKDRRGLEPSIAIKTLEGVMNATPGDWIIEGVNGEFYPCKPDIFEKTYELVGE